MPLSDEEVLALLPEWAREQYEIYHEWERDRDRFMLIHATYALKLCRAWARDRRAMHAAGITNPEALEEFMDAARNVRGTLPYWGNTAGYDFDAALKALKGEDDEA